MAPDWKDFRPSDHCEISRKKALEATACLQKNPNHFNLMLAKYGMQYWQDNYFVEIEMWLKNAENEVGKVGKADDVRSND